LYGGLLLVIAWPSESKELFEHNQYDEACFPDGALPAACHAISKPSFAIDAIFTPINSSA
jgi:hypothetical protein